MKTIRENAERFAVWRMGNLHNLHNWECTYDEAATATGLPVAQVKRICVANRWRFFEEAGQIEDVDSMMLAQNAVDVLHIHV